MLPLKTTKNMKQIPIYEFREHRHGEELLMDVHDMEDVMVDIKRTPAFALNFYCVLLVLGGEDTIAIDGHERTIEPGMVILSIPGEVWSFPENPTIQALGLFFQKEFLLSFINDPYFLPNLTFLRANRPMPYLQPDKMTFERLFQLFQDMEHEINDFDHRDIHMLRALTYQSVMLLQRIPMIDDKDTTNQRAIPGIPISRYADVFTVLVHNYYRQEHGTQFYAKKLNISPNYLNKIVQQHLGRSAKSYILDQVMTEACRLLRYSNLSVSEIAKDLCFSSTTYFVRLFGKYLGQTPLDYRIGKKPRNGSALEKK